jgi:hypothetical protein
MTMPLWQLMPVDPRDPNWEASSYRGKVIVRARDEWTARRKAERAFGVKTRFPPGEGVRAPPWLRPASVRAEIVEDPRYEPHGPAEILYPPDV